MSKTQRKGVLVEVESEKADLRERWMDGYQAAVLLAQTYRLDSLHLYKILLTHYPYSEIPIAAFELIRQQLERQVINYQVVTETIEEALALVKQGGFELELSDGSPTYITHIRINRTNLEKYVLWFEKYKELSAQPVSFGFHYDPYNFDSQDEFDFFLQIMNKLGENPHDVEDIYFTGALTDRNKTDFIFEYKDEQGNWRAYSPDFLIRKKDGKSLIVEVKAEPFRNEAAEKELRALEVINPETIRYELILMEKGESVFGKLGGVNGWVRSPLNKEGH